MKLLYKPFAIISGVIGAKVGHQVFKAVWSKIDDAEPPEPTAADASLGKAVGAAALEAATLAGAKALIARASARSFHYLTGIWPGGKDSGGEEAAEAAAVAGKR
jgi:hypothetical protein